VGLTVGWVVTRSDSSGDLPNGSAPDQTGEITILEDESYEPRVGAHAPLFELSTLSGKQISLAQFRGRPVILEFWTSWCTNCLATVPHLRAFQTAHPETTVIAVNMGPLDRPADVDEYVKRHQLNYLVALDPTGDVTQLYRVYQTSTAVFIDSQGVIRVIHPGRAMTLEEIEHFYQQIRQASP
jgi:cytochrome c biogenesis protein CcmG/thiol:disulfide interchange protein DsbE